MRTLQAQSACQGYPEAMYQDGFWKLSGRLPSLCSVPLPRRKSKELVAAGSKAAAGHNTRAPVSLCHVGSKLPYRKAAALLKDLLPVSTEGVSHATVRRHTLSVGARLNFALTSCVAAKFKCPYLCKVEMSGSSRAVRNVGIDVLYRFPRAVGSVGQFHRSTLPIRPSFPPLLIFARAFDN
jgi:hypothetical protein